MIIPELASRRALVQPPAEAGKGGRGTIGRHPELLPCLPRVWVLCTAISGALHERELQGAGCIVPGCQVACCWQGLAIGHHRVVNVAQEARENLLMQAGRLRCQERFIYT